MLFQMFRHFVLTKTNVFYGLIMFLMGIVTLFIDSEPGVVDATPFIVLSFLGFCFIFFVKPSDIQKIL